MLPCGVCTRGNSMLQSLIALLIGMRQCKIPSARQLVVVVVVVVHDDENEEINNGFLYDPTSDVTHTVSTMTSR